MRTDDDLSKLVNQSGFPLQLGIDRLVRDQAAINGWRVLYREHGWQNKDGQSGFADLVLEDQYRSSVLILECKRVQESDWIFLEEVPVPTPDLKVRPWVTNTANHGREHFGYFDALAKPEAHQSNFCVVAGQDKSRPMLERLAAEVMSATEAIAVEEHSKVSKAGHGLRMYIPVIITTAKLFVSAIDSANIDLSTGSANSISHAEVPWVKFRKQLSSDYAVAPDDWNFQSMSLAKEKVVFVVQVNSFLDFLKTWVVISGSLRALER